MTDKRQYLLTVLRDESVTLHNIIRSYVVKMGLARGTAANTRTEEIINEMTIAALQHIDSFDESRRMIPWLLGIAINRIRRCLSERQRAQKREIAVHDLYPETQTQHSEDELFDRFANLVTQPNTLESQQQVTALLEPLAEPDREILRLAIVQELDSPTVAKQLNISPTAVRVRVHRALKRLRGHMQLKEASTHDQ